MGQRVEDAIRSEWSSVMDDIGAMHRPERVLTYR
jgi:hypothetical protein